MEKKDVSEKDVGNMTPRDFRRIVRAGGWTGHTKGGVCNGYAQMNMVILPQEFAFEFLLYCHRNPRVFAVNDITDPGDPHPQKLAPEADLRTDVPRYQVYKNGQLVDEPTDIKAYWRDDLVAFLTGCTLGHEWLLQTANVKFRYIGSLISNIQCVPAGRFGGPMVVGCRFIRGTLEAIRAVQITSRNTAAHGAPVFIGDPAAIGIKDLHLNYKGDYLDFPPLESDEIPMFWGQGAGPQTREAIKESQLPLMITHKGGHMFISDKLTAELAGQ